MLTIENIDNKLVEVSKTYATAIDKGKKDFNEKIPKISASYILGVKQYLEIKTHIDSNYFPEHLFLEKSPNQSIEEFEYTRKNYRPVTIPVMTDFFNALNRVMARNLYSYDSKGNDILTEYLFENLPIYGDLEKFFKDVCLPWQNTDPNGVLVVKPHDLPVREDGTIDQTQEIEPTVYLYHCENVPLYKKDEFCLILLPEKSLVKVGQDSKLEGFVYEFYDKDSIYRLIQTGKKEEYKFEIQLYWKHGLDKLPVTILGKRQAEKENEIYFVSPIYPSINPLNMALLDSSTLQIAKYKNAFPHMWVVRDSCDETGCENGRIKNHSTGNYHDCPKCSSKSGPLVEFTLKPAMDPTATEGNIPTPPLGFVAPGTEILDFLRKEIEFHLNLAREQLKIGNSKSDVKGSETALGKMIDREETFTFIKGISDHNFDLFRWAIGFIAQMRYGLNVELPVVIEPDSFEIKTSNDLAIEYNEAVSNGMPSVISDMLLVQYLDKKFADDERNFTKLEIQIKIDRLISMTPDAIQKGLAQRNISRVEKIVHDSFNTFLENALIVDPKFMEKDLETQRKIIFGLAQNSLNQIDEGLKRQSEIANILPKIE